MFSGCRWGRWVARGGWQAPGWRGTWRGCLWCWGSWDRCRGCRGGAPPTSRWSSWRTRHCTPGVEQSHSEPQLCKDSHLVIDSKHVHDINPDVDDVDLAGEGKIELVIVPRQTQMLGEGDVGVAHHLLLGSVGPWQAAILHMPDGKCRYKYNYIISLYHGIYYHFLRSNPGVMR